MSKPDSDGFKDAKRWIETNSWWLHTIIIIAILALLLNTGQFRNYDTIGLALTTLEVFLIVVAFIGFWLIRREAIAEARETAERVASEMITNRLQKVDGNQPRGEASKPSAALPELPSTDDKVAEGEGL